jgi:hypothetical protein
MTTRLVVQTARIDCDNADRFDITRKSGGPTGEPFAPSWNTLGPVLKLRKEAEELAKKGAAASRSKLSEEAKLAWTQGRAVEREFQNAWARYIGEYTAEMRVSYRSHRAAWDALLARETVTLVCYCVDATHCHRTILGRDILPKLGAKYLGETQEYLDRRRNRAT